MAKSKSGKEFSTKSKFTDVVSDGYYVDKSLLIKDLVDEYPIRDAFLFTRPRRFGKSLNLSMIQTFFEKTDEDTSVYFKDLDIWKCGGKYTSEQGKYPVIRLDFKDVLNDSWIEMYSSIKGAISRIYKKYRNVETSLMKDDAEIFKNIRLKKAEKADMVDSLRFLSEALSAYYGVKPIILIDEYDVPIQKGYEKGYYDDVISFIRGLFSAALKGNEYMTFAVITGAMRIAKESIFTGLNNLAVYSVLDDEYSRYYGFTRDEVKKILEDFGHPEKMDEVCEWYDGYLFGETEIFNPWSVAWYVTKNFKPESYWANTSGNFIIKDMLRVTTKDVSDQVLEISQGMEVSVPIDENVSFPDLKEDPANVFSVMLSTGYLKATSRTGKMCTVVIPNAEVAGIYSDEIRKNVWRGGVTNSDLARQALIEGDAEELSRILSETMLRAATGFETAFENAYQIFMIGVAQHLSDIYVMRANSKAGYGLSDLEMLPKNIESDLPGIIFEYKCCHRDDELDAAADRALAQIEEKKYDVNLLDGGVTKIDKYGIAFFGQHVVVKKA